jgi:hypothetical protein
MGLVPMLIDLIWIMASVLMFVSKSLSQDGFEAIIWAVAMFYGFVNLGEESKWR